MDTVRQDLRYAIRLLVKDKAFAATTILTLALCIGANTAIFAVVRSVLLRPLPYPQSDRLVYAYDSFPGAGVERAGSTWSLTAPAAGQDGAVTATHHRSCALDGRRLRSQPPASDRCDVRRRARARR
jgi:hypothetical protein